ncbi:MAG TPA: hypothetical protein VM345_13465 [Acidimicrobiales bacterium]|nr:hypothetical protein [Acidimicrobiales bacterium]
MRRLAIVTARDSAELWGDGEHLLGALAHVGIEGVTVPWGRLLDPDQFVGALIRTTWDYVDARDEFIRWAREVEALLPLTNDASLLEWNTDKRYLRDLERVGVPVVSTLWVEPGDDVPAVPWERFVVKPSVSCGGRHSASYSRTRGAAEGVAHAGSIATDGGVAMIQPHLRSVDEQGEVGVYVVDGAATHAVRKGGILVTGAAPVDDLSLAIEQHTGRADLDDELRAFALDAVGAIPAHLGRPLYARVDIVRGDSGEPLLIELEAIEPFLFFEHTPEAAAPFAAAVDEWLHREHARRSGS